MLVPTATALRHLRVDADDTDEVAQVEFYLEAAGEAACTFMNRQLFEDQTTMDAAVAAGTAGDYPIVITKAMQAAILLTLGHLYENREDSVVGATAVTLPNGAQALLQPHRMNMGI